MRFSHFGLRTPAKPGTTARTGKPCSGNSDAPFIAKASSVSPATALASGIETP